MRHDNEGNAERLLNFDKLELRFFAPVFFFVVVFDLVCAFVAFFVFDFAFFFPAVFTIVDCATALPVQIILSFSLL